MRTGINYNHKELGGEEGGLWIALKVDLLIADSPS